MSRETALLLVKVLEIVAAGVALAPTLRRRVDRYTGRVRLMIEEGRDPTPEEWRELLAESDDVSKRIRAAREARERAGEAPEEVPVEVDDEPAVVPPDFEG